MKHYIQQIFENMGRPENFWLSIILIMLYTLFAIILGMCIAWIIFMIVNRDVKPITFDDLINNDMRIHRIKKVK